MKMDTSKFISFSLLFLIFVYCDAKLPEMDLSSVDLIKYWGYPVETHKAQTKDGYILTLHRIPYGQINSTDAENKTKPIFFLQHALLATSSSFFLNLPHQNLAFLLADAGYDVWMGNARGNTYSKNHVSLNVSSQEFWDFSFQEMAEYDLPAMIDYTLKHTKQKQLYYVGHSQGNMMAFAGLSENQELQKKIKIFFAMAPVTRMVHVSTIFHYLAKFRTPIRWLCYVRGIYEVMASSENTKALGKVICPYIPWICEKFIFLLNGFDKKNLNATRMPIYLTNIPAGTSEKNFDHYFQNLQMKLFIKYDYGETENIKRYGSKHAPKYSLRSIKTPVVLLHGEHDSIAQLKDVTWAARRLPNVLYKKMIKGYNHIDFITAVNAPQSVYNHIMEIAKNVLHV